jgi:hypothetical protein
LRVLGMIKTLPVGDLVFEVWQYPYPKDQPSCACGSPATTVVILPRLNGDVVFACRDHAEKYFRRKVAR